MVNPLVGERALYSCDIGTPAENLKTAWPQLDFSARSEKNMPEKKWWPARGEMQEDLERRVHAFLMQENDPALTASTLVVSHWYFIYTVTALDADNADIIWRDAHGRFHKRF
jgi:hypothetical protein